MASAMASSDEDAAGCSPPSGGLQIGTWNVSHWSPERAAVIAADVKVDILAMQETHLAVMPLQWAHSTARAMGLHLHHGRPVLAAGNSDHGKSCGVGFVTSLGVAVSPVLPSGSAWRMLHAARRLHAIRLPPRPGLPLGLQLFTVYAPLAIQALERTRFDAAMLEFTHTLDMQVPTLLLGDFNGSICPPRDFQSASGSHRPACPLLSALLGPAGAWSDVHVTLLPPPIPWTFRQTDTKGNTSASCVDLILANRSALPLLQSASVLSGVQHGGHCPVLVTLRVVGSISISWQRPRPPVPSLLCSPSCLPRMDAVAAMLVSFASGRHRP